MSVGTSAWKIPDTPPIRKLNTTPTVPSAARKITPVGIEITSVVAMNGISRKSCMPLVNRWCAHTIMLRNTIARIEPTTYL